MSFQEAIRERIASPRGEKTRYIQISHRMTAEEVRKLDTLAAGLGFSSRAATARWVIETALPALLADLSTALEKDLEDEVDDV